MERKGFVVQKSIFYSSLYFMASMVLLLILKVVKNSMNEHPVLFNFVIENLALFYVVLSSAAVFLVFLFFFKENFKKQQHIENIARDYKEIVNNANALIIKYDLEGNITFCNKHALKTYGYTPEEIGGQNLFEVLKPHHNLKRKLNKSVAKVWFKRLLNTASQNSYAENWNVTKLGKRVFIGWTTIATFDQNNEISGGLSIGIDLTEQKIMQNRITENEKRFKYIFSQVEEGITILSKKGEILDMNKAGLEFLGLNRADIQGDNKTISLVREIIPNVDWLINEIVVKGEVYFETELKDTQGNIVPSEFFGKLITYEGEEAILAVSRNIRERVLHQQKILNAAVTAEEQERSRLAKELHDSVSPILSAAKLYAQTLRFNKSDSLRPEIISNLEETINESITSISNISVRLSPHILQNFGLVEAIKSHSSKISDSTKIHINIVSNFDFRLKPDIEITLYRVATELLNNTLKHANASEVTIEINSETNLSFIYTDNGNGFDMAIIGLYSKGMGLFNIKNRITGISGIVNFYSQPGQGFVAKIELPDVKPN